MAKISQCLALCVVAAAHLYGAVALGCEDGLKSWRAALSSRVPLIAPAPNSPPFSFLLDGVSSAELLPKWTCNAIDRTLPGGARSLQLQWASPSGLAVMADVRIFKSSQLAVDWVLNFININATEVTGVLSQPRSVDAAWAAGDDTMLLSNAGSSSGPSDYANLSWPLPPSARQNFAPLDYYDGNGRSAGAGRSSNGQLPFWHIESASRRAGLSIGLGWTGQWNANFSRSADGASARVIASIADANFVLLPSESMRLLRVLVSSFNQTDLASSGYAEDQLPLHAVALASFRRLLLSEYSVRKADGSLAYPKIAELGYPYDQADGLLWNPGALNETNQLSTMRAIKDGPAAIEEYWLDVGWERSVATDAGNSGGFWANHGYPLENTYTTRFPRGVGPIFDLGKDAQDGGRYVEGVLWIAFGGTLSSNYLAQVHPEWMLRSPENFVNGSVNVYGIDLSVDEAASWVRSWLVDTMRTWNYDVFRHEMGMDYAHVPMWRWKDSTLPHAPLRHGVTEIKYINNQIKIYEGIVRDVPGAVVDTCAGGGRAIDLETISRGIWKWRSDYSGPHGWFPNQTDPIISISHQSMTMGLGHLHPMNAHFSYRPTAYHWRSAATTGLVIAWDIRNDTASESKLLALAVAETIRLRPYTIHGDLWHLTTQSLDPTVWAAWQYHDPSSLAGYAVYFRRPQAAAAAMATGLKGLTHNRCYRLQVYDETYSLAQNTTMFGLELRKYLIGQASMSVGCGESVLLEYSEAAALQCNSSLLVDWASFV